jgi:hypothetical protein
MERSKQMREDMQGEYAELNRREGDRPDVCVSHRSHAMSIGLRAYNVGLEYI